MSYPHPLVIQRILFSKGEDFEFVASCKSSIHQIGD
jgi:hypothetical protein